MDSEISMDFRGFDVLEDAVVLPQRKKPGKCCRFARALGHVFFLKVLAISLAPIVGRTFIQTVRSIL